MTTIHTLLTTSQPHDRLHCAIYEQLTDLLSDPYPFKPVTSFSLSLPSLPSLRFDPKKAYVLNIFSQPDQNSKTNWANMAFTPSPTSNTLEVTFTVTCQRQKKYYNPIVTTFEVTRRYTNK